MTNLQGLDASDFESITVDIPVGGGSVTFTAGRASPGATVGTTPTGEIVGSTTANRLGTFGGISAGALLIAAIVGVLIWKL